MIEEAKKQITEAQIEEAYQKDISQGLHKVQELPAEPEKKDSTPARGIAGRSTENAGITPPHCYPCAESTLGALELTTCEDAKDHTALHSIIFAG
jgi:hypothetical protein